MNARVVEERLCQKCGEPYQGELPDVCRFCGTSLRDPAGQATNPTPAPVAEFPGDTGKYLYPLARSLEQALDPEQRDPTGGVLGIVVVFLICLGVSLFSTICLAVLFRLYLRVIVVSSGSFFGVWAGTIFALLFWGHRLKKNPISIDAQMERDRSIRDDMGSNFHLPWDLTSHWRGNRAWFYFIQGSFEFLALTFYESTCHLLRRTVPVLAVRLLGKDGREPIDKMSLIRSAFLLLAFQTKETQVLTFEKIKALETLVEIKVKEEEVKDALIVLCHGKFLAQQPRVKTSFGERDAYILDAEGYRIVLETLNS